MSMTSRAIQAYMQMSTAEYTAYAARTYAAEKATIDRLKAAGKI